MAAFLPKKRTKENRALLMHAEMADDVRLRLLVERASSLWDAIVNLPELKISADSRRRLLKVVGRERKFLELLANGEKEPSVARLSSTNLSHLEAILAVLQHEQANGASAIMQVFHINGETLKALGNERAGGVSTPLPNSSDEGTSEGVELEGADSLGYTQRKRSSMGCETLAMQHETCSDNETQQMQDLVEQDSEALVHVDVVCSFRGRSAWVSVSGRTPWGLSWHDSRDCSKNWKGRCELLLKAATVVPQDVRPECVLLYFGRGICDEMEEGLLAVGAVPLTFGQSETAAKAGVEKSRPLVVGLTALDADEGDWVLVERPVIVTSLSEAVRATTVRERSEEVAVERMLSAEANQGRWFALCQGTGRNKGIYLGESDASVNAAWGSTVLTGSETLHFDKALEESVSDGREMVNLDTTALVAMVSHLSNGGAVDLAHCSEVELQARFRNTWKFMRDQAVAELRSPVRVELERMLEGKLPVVCRHVYDEFTSIAFTIGGPQEKERAREVLAGVRVVPNMPSARVAALAESGAVKSRHKVVFGTGDSLHAPTVSANMAFVRAVQQRGVPLHFIQHAPRALTGD